jgi:hypothetical protein
MELVPELEHDLDTYNFQINVIATLKKTDAALQEMQATAPRPSVRHLKGETKAKTLEFLVNSYSDASINNYQCRIPHVNISTTIYLIVQH